ncbi:MAG: hypothetical protein SOR94_01325 [Lawsonella sp.]|uniref:hypothetical protein n=1 Tax=Lawsonella sp. TaxID=2041415 RepID=UPI002A75E960|nr:hypothetical protein [Lawsonella sp.]MDY2978668.1 hypothetical protein [Lawsonella sp.]
MLKHALGVAASFLALACGLGVGAAQAADAPTPSLPSSAHDIVTTSDVQVTAPNNLGSALTFSPGRDARMQLDAPAQPASHVPSSQDILSFLHSSLLLAGRDILSHGAQGTITTAASTARHGQLVALTGLVDTRKDNTPLTNAPEFIKNLGEDIDGMWAIVAESASRVPVLGEMVYDIIDGMRHSRYWKNDYYRILRTTSIFVALTGLVLGPLTGLAAAVVIAFTLVLPVTAVLLTGAVFFGIVALPVAFLNGIVLVILSGTTWLLTVSSGIAMIVFGALLAAGVVDLFAGLSFVFTLPIIPIPINFTPIVLAALAVVARLLGVGLVVFGIIVLMASGILLVGVLFGLMMILAPWLFIAGLFLLAAAIWLFAFIISLAIIGPIALITIPLATLPWMVAALAVFLFGMFVYAVSGNTNRGPQHEAVNQTKKQKEEAAAAGKSKAKGKGKNKGKGKKAASKNAKNSTKATGKKAANTNAKKNSTRNSKKGKKGGTPVVRRAQQAMSPAASPARHSDYGLAA